jgi:hypothetical protein
MVLDALKKRLHNASNTKGGKWIKELPNALWGIRTQPTKQIGQSPYFLVYGSEAILPAATDDPLDELVHRYGRPHRIITEAILLDFLDELVHRYGRPHRIITDLVPTSTTISFGSTARTAGLTFGMSRLPIHGPTDKSCAPMGWYSTL